MQVKYCNCTLAGISRLSRQSKTHAESQCTLVNKHGHMNNPLDSAVWAELNNCSGMRSIISIFIQLLTFILKFVKLTEESVIILKITLSCHHQLEKAGAFLPDSKCHGKLSNHMFGAKFPVCNEVS